MVSVTIIQLRKNAGQPYIVAEGAGLRVRMDFSSMAAAMEFLGRGERVEALVDVCIREIVLEIRKTDPGLDGNWDGRVFQVKGPSATAV